MDKEDLAVCLIAFHLGLTKWIVNARRVYVGKFLKDNLCKNLFILFIFAIWSLLNDRVVRLFSLFFLTGKTVTVTSATVAPFIMRMELSLGV